MNRICTAALLGLLAALALGCGSSDEETTAATPSAPEATAATPAAPNQPRRMDRPGFDEKKKGGQVGAQIVEGQIPEGFPADFPMYPNSTPKTSMMVGSSGLVVLNSSAAIADVVAHYREQLPSAGWIVDSVNEGAGGTRATVKAHKDMRSATISINQGKSGGTEIGVALRGSS